MAVQAAAPLPPDREPRRKFEALPGGGEGGDAPETPNLTSVPSSPYDAETEGSGRGGLQSITGGGESTERSRDHLKSVGDAENKFDAPKKSQPGSGTPSLFKPEATRTSAGGGALGGSALKDSEKNDTGVKGLYKSAGLKEEDAGFASKIGNISRRRKLLASGGVGGISGLIIAMMLITPVYRVPALMSELLHGASKEVDHVVEKRAERMLVLYLIGKAGGNPTNYVITGSPVSSLWKTFRSRQVEKKIAEQTGITFQKVGDVVHVFHDGKDLGNGATAEKAMAIIDRGTIESRKDFKVILKLVVNFHRASVESRSFKKRFLKGGRYGTPAEDPVEKAAAQSGKEGAEKAAEKEVESLTAQQIDVGTAGTVGEIGDALTCVLDDTGCDTFKENSPDAEVQTQTTQTTDGAVQEVTTAVEEGAADAEKEVVKNREKSFFATLLEKILAKVIPAAAAETAVKAIPFIGWVDLAASLQHAIGNFFANDLAHAIPVQLKENAYGAIFSSWLGYGDQTRAGKTPLPMLAALSDQVGDINGAATWKYQEGKGTNAGIPVNPKVGSSTYSEAGNLINGVYNNLGVRLTVRGPLELWYYTIGKLLKLIGTGAVDGIGFIFNHLGIGFSGVLEDIFGKDWQKSFGEFAVKAVMYLFGIAIDPLARGAQLFNILFTGGSVAMNYHCHFYLGCKALTQRQGVIINLQLQQQDDEDLALTPLRDRLFSLNEPRSLTSTLVRAAPTSMKPGNLIASLFGQVTKLPSSILSAFSPKLRAAELDDVSELTWVQQYGAEEDDLNRDVAPALRSQAVDTPECPKTDPAKEFNDCQADISVMASLSCMQGGPCPEFQDPADDNAGGGGNSGSPDCATAQGNAKILCEAKKYDPVSYEESARGGHLASAAAWLKTCPVIDKTCLLDCSGLVNIAVWDAFKVDLNENTNGEYADTEHWKHIDQADLQPGDLIQPNSGHVEIVDHIQGKIIHTFGAHTWRYTQERQVGPAQYSTTQNFYAALRFTGKGAK